MILKKHSYNGNITSSLAIGLIQDDQVEEEVRVAIFPRFIWRCKGWNLAFFPIRDPPYLYSPVFPSLSVPPIPNRRHPVPFGSPTCIFSLIISGKVEELQSLNLYLLFVMVWQGSPLLEKAVGKHSVNPVGISESQQAAMCLLSPCQLPVGSSMGNFPQ